MSEFATAHTSVPDSAGAGKALGTAISASLAGQRPDALVVFASSRYDYRALLEALEAECRPRLMVGCSSAGEFTTGEHLTQSACAAAIRSDEIAFSATFARGLRWDWRASAAELVSGLSGVDSYEYPHNSAMILTDALAGHVNEMVGEITRLTRGRYQFFGGGACDDGRFLETHVFFGTEPMVDAVVALEIRSHRPIGLGLQHGWEPASRPMRVTASQERRLIALDGAPAVEAFQEHASRTEQAFVPSDPIPFFLHNVLGIDTGLGYRLSVPLAVNEDGSLTCAADVPVGTLVHIMGTGEQSAAGAATGAAHQAISGLGESQPGLAFVFDCVATRLRMGAGFDLELRSVAEALGASRMVGCNTNGQVARGDQQFSGFHNCTAVVAVLPG